MRNIHQDMRLHKIVIDSWDRIHLCMKYMKMRMNKFNKVQHKVHKFLLDHRDRIMTNIKFYINFGRDNIHFHIRYIQLLNFNNWDKGQDILNKCLLYLLIDYIMDIMKHKILYIKYQFNKIDKYMGIGMFYKEVHRLYRFDFNYWDNIDQDN